MTFQISGDPLARTQHPSRTGFTLVELLVVIAIMAALMGILFPAISGAIASARGFRCQMSLRSVGFDFSVFADDTLHGDRGDDNGRNSFSLETFQESQYGVDEFWRWGNASEIDLPDAEGNDPMRCPSVKQPLTLRRNLACSSGAVGPPQSVSFGFNGRLNRAEVIDDRGRPRAVQVRIRPHMVDAADVPLLIDVDGQTAFDRGVNPIYTAPGLDSQAVYAGDRFWYPALRHRGQANAVFLDGHVGSSTTPATQSGWNWAYQPIR